MAYKASVIVPVYNPPVEFAKELVESMLSQSYSNWELCLADGGSVATKGEGTTGERTAVEELLRDYAKLDSRIKYKKLPVNMGISGNTNAAYEMATGEYIGLLDHDDMLGADCLYEIVAALNVSRYDIIYTDEDKGDGEMTRFYDVNQKPAFDQDYLWANNYICHFTVLEANLMKELGFRTAFDGAQDFDIFLRAARKIAKESEKCYQNSQVVNIPNVSYHWRCHEGSTAVNPQSKLYAYEAGKKAVEEDLKERGIEAIVRHSKHLGFYQVAFEDIFRDRPEVAMVAGPVYKKGRIAGGARDEKDKLLYGGLRKGFSGGHLHRASVWQQCYAADFSNAIFREALFSDFLKNQGINSKTEISKLPNDKVDSLRMAWANYVHEKGLLILYNPEME